MAKQEFLLLIPAIIFGVAIVDLLKLFSHKKTYFELMGWGIFLLMAIINLWINLYEKLDVITSGNLMFLLIIVQAMLYARAANIITPEEKDVDTKKYFLSNYKSFFYLLVAISIVNSLLRYFVYDDNQAIWVRPLAIVLALICIVFNRVWVRTPIMIVFLILGALLLVNGIR